MLYLELFHSQVSFPHWGEAVTVPGFPTVQSDLQRKSVSLGGGSGGRGEWGDGGRDLPKKQGLFFLSSWHLIGSHRCSCSFLNNPMARGMLGPICLGPVPKPVIAARG